MKRQDLLLILFLVLLFSPFVLFEEVFDAYLLINRDHGFLMSSLKFAVLATLGELVGLRIGTGSYFKPGFGIIPRAIVWGVLGFVFKAAFIVYGVGVPALLAYIGMDNVLQSMSEGFTLDRVLIALSISVFANILFSPLIMTLHKVTDIHIVNTGGTVKGLLTPIKFAEILDRINWNVQWNFVFMKTIPLFWIPAHTITFLLPSEWQVLFAALLGVALGIIMAIASLRSQLPHVSTATV